MCLQSALPVIGWAVYMLPGFLYLLEILLMPFKVAMQTAKIGLVAVPGMKNPAGITFGAGYPGLCFFCCLCYTIGAGHQQIPLYSGQGLVASRSLPYFIFRLAVFSICLLLLYLTTAILPLFLCFVNRMVVDCQNNYCDNR
jgi:hypothetical protein